MYIQQFMVWKVDRIFTCLYLLTDINVSEIEIEFIPWKNSMHYTPIQTYVENRISFRGPFMQIT